jgi:asparagine synthase (glutamine-hydrolysing)
MCGFAGTTKITPHVLEEFAKHLAHRGPDDRGIWCEGDLGLAHTRLAIIDLSPGGHQPMVSACGRWVISYNGEIYNYQRLRAELEARGETFRSTSDTEVLLTLLARDGTAALTRVFGMFALALWDRERRELLLARDHLGIKPLVYAQSLDGSLAFASEIDALSVYPGIDMSIDPEAISEYLACLYVPAPRTARRGIRKLPPGHFLQWRNGSTTIERYWQPDFVGGKSPSVAVATDELLSLLRQVIADHMVADVPVGCFLSGGIDSSVIAALMAEEARRWGAPPIRTFTMTFSESAYDEREAARAIAEHIGSVHTELPASATGIADRVPGMLRAFGEPFGNPTSLLIDSLSAMAREHVTVALVGDGGDEVFGGYPRYAGGLLAKRYRKLPRWLRKNVLSSLAKYIPESTGGHHLWRRGREFMTGADLPDAEMYAGWVEYFSPQERAALLDLEQVPARPIAALYKTAPSQDSLDAMQQTDLQSFLPGNLLAYGDAMSMSHAFELRLPLLDHRVVEMVGRLDPALRFAEGKKTLLRAVAARLLPASIVNRPKRGFNPPMGLWLKRELAGLVAERLQPSRLEAIGISPEPVARLLDEYARGRRDNALKIWSLLMLEMWASA